MKKNYRAQVNLTMYNLQNPDYPVHIQVEPKNSINTKNMTFYSLDSPQFPIFIALPKRKRTINITHT